MAQRGYFFDSVGTPGDRQYSSSYWASLMQFLRREGVVPAWLSELAVTENSPQGMSVKVGLGAALVQGRAFEVYTSAEPVTISTAHATLPRIDRIVLRLDYVGRALTVLTKAGTPGASPSAPALTRDANTYEVSLARVAVAAGATLIQNANITDERADTAVCGYSTLQALDAHETAGTLDHPDGSVTSAKLATGAVTTPKIATSAVDSTKLAAGAVIAGKIAADAVDATAIAAGAVGTAELAAGAVAAGKIAAGAVGAAEIADGTVGTAELANLAVTSGKLADDAVTSAKLAAGAVDTAALDDDAVTPAKLAAASVTSPAIASGAVVLGKLGAGAVSTGAILDDAVTAPKIAAGAVGTSELTSPLTVTGLVQAHRDLASPTGTTAITAADDVITVSTGASDRAFSLPPCIPGKRYTVVKRDGGAGAIRINASAGDAFMDHTGATAGQLVIAGIGDAAIFVGGTSTWFVLAQEIGPGGITEVELAAGSVGSSEIANGAVTTAKLAADAVDASKIQAGAVGSSEIAPGAVGAAEIANGSVGTDELAPGAVTSAKITAGAVDAAAIAAGAVGSSEIAAGAVTLSKLADDSVDSTKLVAAAVDSPAIATGAVNAGKLAANAVTTAAINAAAVTTAKIADGAVISAKIASPIALAGISGARQDFASAGGTISGAADLVTCLTGASTRTLTLPPASEGKIYAVIKRDSGAGSMVIQAAGADSIQDIPSGGGAGSKITLTVVGASALIIGGTSLWWIIAIRGGSVS